LQSGLKSHFKMQSSLKLHDIGGDPPTPYRDLSQFLINENEIYHDTIINEGRLNFQKRGTMQNEFNGKPKIKNTLAIP